MRSEQQRPFILRHAIAALILLGLIACAMSGCGPVYDYPGYPEYGYAPYSSWGWGNTWGYNPVFVVHHPWEEHHYVGHHTEFYHGGFAGGGGFHGAVGGYRGGGGGGVHGGGGHGGGHR